MFHHLCHARGFSWFQKNEFHICIQFIYNILCYTYIFSVSYFISKTVNAVNIKRQCILFLKLLVPFTDNLILYSYGTGKVQFFFHFSCIMYTDISIIYK